MRIKGHIVAAAVSGLLLSGFAPAPPATAAATEEFYAWGTIVRRDYGLEDSAGGAANLRAPDGPPVLNQLQEPNAIRIDVAGGTANALAFRDRGATLRIVTDNADWRHGTTSDRPRDWSNPPVGAVVEFVGRVDPAGGNNFVAEIVRPHEFEVAEHQDNGADMTYVSSTAENGDEVQNYEGSVTSGPLAGWAVSAGVHCALNRVVWTAADGSGHSLSGTYRADYDPESLSRVPYALTTTLDGGSGVYAGVTGGARLHMRCDDLAAERTSLLAEPVEAELEIDIRA